MQLLDARVPEWRAVRLTFQQIVLALKDHHDAFGTFPSSRSTDPDVLSLAHWLNTQRAKLKAGSLPVERRRLLDNQASGWGDTPAQNWERILGEIAVYRRLHGYFPTPSDGEQRVRRMARWLSDQRTGRNVTPEREARLNEVLPGWRAGQQGQRFAA